VNEQSELNIFISYSHADKLVARRVFRQLTTCRINVMLDERELELAAQLTPAIRSKIQSADILLVLASQTSKSAKWVELEMQFARDCGKAILPVFIDPVKEHPRFAEDLGVDATQADAFADAIHDIICKLFSMRGLPVPDPDQAVLIKELRELEKEEPALVPLISNCLDDTGLYKENEGTVYSVPFHALDYAIDALFELKRDSNVARHAATGFRAAGVGVRALSRWIDATGDGEMLLVSAVGHRLNPARIPAALGLLARCRPPNDHALSCFIHDNGASFDDAQARTVIRLAVWPVRPDPAGSRCDAAAAALKRFPYSPEIQQIWCRWIQDGKFDGSPCSPGTLAFFQAEAHKAGLPGWKSVNEALRSHVGGCLRSCDEHAVYAAIQHIKAAADAGAPVLDALLAEMRWAMGSDEWQRWRTRDPEKRDSLWCGAKAIIEEAEHDRNWHRATVNAKKCVEVARQRRQGLGNTRQ
jgi:hypothetical protein